MITNNVDDNSIYLVTLLFLTRCDIFLNLKHSHMMTPFNVYITA